MKGLHGSICSMPERSTLLRHGILILCLLLALATLAVYWQVQEHEFVTYDDLEYVVENPHVRHGLSRQGIRWAFTAVHASNWHPLTWLSHMVDCQLYGLNPSGHHFNSLLLHTANTLLLFLLMRNMTGTVWRSFFVAFLFALHPLHVESVAWVAERKDVLSGLFWMLTLWGYADYVRRGRWPRYTLCLLLFLMGLLCKPMLVTLPFVLLLLDFWPLMRRRPGIWLVAEKIPFFLLSFASAVVTYRVQEAGGALKTQIPLALRAENALTAYAGYLAKAMIPYPLSFFYPHPMNSLSPFHVWGAAMLLLCVTWAAWRYSTKIPYLGVGWLWYLGTLVPVIGLVQAGAQAMADRYTYIPLIGVFMVLSWGTAHLISIGPRLKRPLILLWGCWLPALMILSWHQIGKWKDSITLYTHGIRVNEANYVAQLNLGNALARQSRLEEAVFHYREALRLNPSDSRAHNNLANVLRMQGRGREAILHYREALRIRPDFPEARYNLELTIQRLSAPERDVCDLPF
jgi:tetratricopeptide (TPR) repeat protein